MRLLAMLALLLPSCNVRDYYAAWLLERELSEPWFSSSIAIGTPTMRATSQGDGHNCADNPSSRPSPPK